jgi:hypothetical protein
MIPKKPAPDLIRGGYRFQKRSCSNNELENQGELSNGDDDAEREQDENLDT